MVIVGAIARIALGDAAMRLFFIRMRRKTSGFSRGEDVNPVLRSPPDRGWSAWEYHLQQPGAGVDQQYDV